MPGLVGSDAFPSRGTRAYPSLPPSNAALRYEGMRSLLFSRIVELYRYWIVVVDWNGGEINDYQRGRRIGWFQRTFRVFSVDHSSTILVYVYIYIERIYTIAMYIIGSTTKNVDLVSGFSCKSRQGRSTFVCVRVPGARLLTTFSFDLRHALHLWQRGNVFRVFQETSRYPHASNTRLEECPSPSTISNVLFGRMVERDGFLNAWNRSS